MTTKTKKKVSATAVKTMAKHAHKVATSTDAPSQEDFENALSQAIAGMGDDQVEDCGDDE